MADAFFHRDGDVLVGNDAARGPWDEAACHAGPVTGAIVGAAEAVIEGKQLARVTANYLRPVPVAGFRLKAEVQRDGRTTALVTVALTDAGDRVCATTECLFIATTPAQVPSATLAGPTFEESVPGEFPVRKPLHDRPGFRDFIDIRYPPGEDGDPGPTTLWMRAPPIIAGEATSAFQSLCPLADCGNGISRNTELSDATCINADLTIQVSRLPQSEWLAARSISFWEQNGVGLSHSLLFDTRGPIGAALQSLVVRARR